MRGDVIENETTCKVLSCDTISQTKDKALDALHPNTPYSSRPSARDVKLCEFRRLVNYATRSYTKKASAEYVV